MTEQSGINRYFALRHYFVVLVLMLLFFMLVGRALYLQVYHQDFLLSEGSQRQLRVIETPAYRGSVFDRNGEPLAVSTPVDSVWANPKKALLDEKGISKVAKQLDINENSLLAKLRERADREFAYLKRKIDPQTATRASELSDAVFLQREYSRFYPAGEVAAHLVGFTDIDNHGLEGLERVYENWLKETVGERQVLRNRKGEVVEEIAQVKAARSGKDLFLSIDMRLQYIAFRALSKAVLKHQANSGSAVVLDAATGEVLALVNTPSFNPNHSAKPGARRNRAITDVFEPGSTIKPFTLAAALDAGVIGFDEEIDTAPGYFKVSGKPIRDHSNYRVLDLEHILMKSSNVGAAKIALKMQPDVLWQHFQDYGFGKPTGVSFPASASGYLRDYIDWYPLDHATLAFGYGLSMSTLQLARAYSIFANQGELLPLSLIKRDVVPQGTRVMTKQTAQQVLHWMEAVVGPQGTAKAASINGYRVAGKTGTAKKTGEEGYKDDSYSAAFAGIVPASKPRLVMAVMIDEPKEHGYYGGIVAAPVFQEVMSHALRLLNISPDDPEVFQQLTWLDQEAH